MPTIKRLAKNSYEVRWDEFGVDGKRHQRRRRFERKHEADDYVNKIHNGETQRLDKGAIFTDWIDDWFESYKRNIEATTILGYQRIIDRCKRYFSGRKLDSIKPSDIDKLYTTLSKKDNGYSKQPLSPASLQRYHALLHRAFTYAVRDDHIGINPMDKVDRPKSITPEIILPSVESVMEHVSTYTNKPEHLPLMLAIMTGMRQSEIMGLLWDSVDLDNGQLTVRRVRQRLTKKQLAAMTLNTHTKEVALPEMKGWVLRETTKAKHTRTISLPPSLVQLLRAAKLTQRENQLRYGPVYIQSDFVCTYTDGKPIGDSTLSKAARPLCRFHDLRHLNATHLIDAGLPVVEVSRRIGHTTPTTTHNTYAHVVKRQDQAAAEALENTFGGFIH